MNNTKPMARCIRNKPMGVSGCREPRLDEVSPLRALPIGRRHLLVRLEVRGPTPSRIRNTKRSPTSVASVAISILHFHLFVVPQAAWATPSKIRSNLPTEADRGRTRRTQRNSR